MARFCGILAIVALDVAAASILLRAAEPHERDQKLALSVVEALKSGDEKLLPPLVMNVDSYRAMAELTKERVDGEEAQRRLQDNADTSLQKAQSGVGRIRKRAEKDGIDWSSAKVRAVVAMKGERLARDEDVLADVFVEISSDTKTIVVKLDDCFLRDGARRIADGMSVVASLPKPQAAN